MATKDQPLQISKFRGINRFDDGTNTPPNEFFTMQNLHPISPGELQSVSGISDLNANTSLPGVGKVVATKFMKDSLGINRLLTFFIPGNLGNWTPSVSGGNFSSSGGATY